MCEHFTVKSSEVTVIEFSVKLAYYKLLLAGNGRPSDLQPRHIFSEAAENADDSDLPSRAVAQIAHRQTVSAVRAQAATEAAARRCCRAAATITEAATTSAETVGRQIPGAHSKEDIKPDEGTSGSRWRCLENRSIG